MRIPFSFSEDSLTMFIGGKVLTIPSTDSAYTDAKEHLKGTDHDVDYLESLMDKPAFISKASSGRVTVSGNNVFFNGEVVHNSLTDKLLNMLGEGFDVQPWVNFMDNMMDNPSFNSRKCLYNFLEHFKAPITEDGCFIAFKRVRINYFDVHSNTMDNSPGKVVSMPRHEVDDNPNQTCSSGLHACADEYLKGFATGSNYRTVAVKINPKNVVAVPVDYQFSKLRVCEYLVLGDVDDKQIDKIRESDYLADDDYDGYAWDFYDYDDPYDYD